MYFQQLLRCLISAEITSQQKEEDAHASVITEWFSEGIAMASGR